MLTKVEVSTRVYPFNLLEPERESVFYVSGGVGIVCQLVMVMEPVVVFSESEGHVPSHPCFLPVAKPLKLCSGFDEELHLHLFELTHAEDELTCHDLIPERFAYLGYPEG